MIGQLLARYPNITITRLRKELQAAGYQGGPTRFSGNRPRRAWPACSARARFETSPGGGRPNGLAGTSWTFSAKDAAGESLQYLLAIPASVSAFHRTPGHGRHAPGGTFAPSITWRFWQPLALYDNHESVVTRWEDDHPISNTAS